MLSLYPSSPPPPRPTTAPSPPASVRLLQTAAARRDTPLACALHAALLKSGALHTPHATAANSLLHAYLQCGLIARALQLFDEMPSRDAASYASLMSGHCRRGAPRAAISIFLDMLEAVPPNEFTVAALLQACGLAKDERLGKMVHGYLIVNGFCCDPFVVGSLVNMYAKIGAVADAQKLVLSLSHRDVVSWTAIVSGCVLNGMLGEALEVFVMMLEDGVSPNNVTMLSVIQACSLMGDPSLFSPVHALVVRLKLNGDVPVVNSLIMMYAKNGLVEESLRLFNDFYLKRGNPCSNGDVLAAIVHGCTVSGSLWHGKEVHGRSFKMGVFPSTIIENSLMAMYARFEQVGAAHLVFRSMEDKDIVSWNTMIVCFARSDRADEALELFGVLRSRGSGPSPDLVTVLSSAQACSKAGSLKQGQMLHGYMIRSGFARDISISNAFIIMYAKVGRIDFAEQIFGEMDVKDLVSWTSMINAYGIHGDGVSALRVFHELKEEGRHAPNAITFVCVISACSHSGLTSEGYECFEAMRRDHGIEPTMEHYAAVVDLLGRSGRLGEAEKFINDMPIKPDSSVWNPLLAACVLHGDVELAERTAGKLSVLEPESDTWRVCLSNIYASAGRWEDSARIRTEMKRDGVTKETGWSFVDVGGVEGFKFGSADARHPEAGKIYAVWSSMNKHMSDVSVDVDQLSSVGV